MGNWFGWGGSQRPIIFRAAPKNRVGDIYYLYDYHPYRGGQNPKFHPYGGKLLDLKEGQAEAIDFFTNQIRKYLGTGFSVVTVPSSDPEKTQPGNRTVAQKLCTSNISDATACLVRHKKIDKLATGGDRRLEVHLKSIRVIQPEVVRGRDVLLIDDITTSGNSLLACRKLLRDSGAKAVECLALGKTFVEGYDE